MDLVSLLGLALLGLHVLHNLLHQRHRPVALVDLLLHVVRVTALEPHDELGREGDREPARRPRPTKVRVK